NATAKAANPATSATAATASTPAAAASSAPAAASSSAAPAASQAAAPGKRGGTPNGSGPAPGVSLDPHRRVTFIFHTEKVYSNLLMTQFSSQKMLFDAAVSLEQPDPMTIRFTMRDGMKFHDPAGNRAVTADDAAYSINRIATQSGRPGPLAASNLTP